MRLTMMVGIAATLLIAGCGAPGAAVTPSPTPNLGAVYLKIVAPLNASADDLNAAVKATPQDNPRIRKAAAAAQLVTGKFITDLLTLSGEAPASAKADITALRQSMATYESLLGAVASSTDANIVVAVLALENAPDHGEAGLVRSDLGLAPPPVGSPSP